MQPYMQFRVFTALTGQDDLDLKGLEYAEGRQLRMVGSANVFSAPINENLKPCRVFDVVSTYVVDDNGHIVGEELRDHERELHIEDMSITAVGSARNETGMNEWIAPVKHECVKKYYRGREMSITACVSKGSPVCTRDCGVYSGGAVKMEKPVYTGIVAALAGSDLQQDAVIEMLRKHGDVRVSRALYPFSREHYDSSMFIFRSDGKTSVLESLECLYEKLRSMLGKEWFSLSVEEPLTSFSRIPARE